MAYRWYEEQRKGLGRTFLISLEKSLHSIQTHPALFPIVHKNTRRALIRRFPYAVFFIREEDAMIILRILHQTRNPNRWKLQYIPRSQRA